MTKALTSFMALACFIAAANTAAGSPGDGSPRGCRAIRLDGVGERVVIPHSKTLCLSGPLTVEMWVRPLRAIVNAPWYPNLIGKRRTNGVYSMWGLGLGAKLEPYTVADSGWLYDERRLPIEEWSHVAVVFDGRQVRFFINGMPGRSHPATSQGPANDEPVIIGTLPENTQNFAGDIASVRVSRSARYKDAFKPDTCWAADESTVLLMSFRREDDRVVDDSGHGNHGSTEGVVEWLDEPRLGVPPGPPR